MKINLFAGILILLIAGCTENLKNSQNEPVAYINPFIGTNAHGHTFPGASMPFGMVQLSPDTRLHGWDGCSGYHYSDSVVFGFSHTHLSGTGVPDYCDILFMPTKGLVLLDNGENNVDSGYASRFSHKNEKAEAGYYSTHLDDYNIDVELTATKRVGFHKYIFNDADTGNIIIDLTHRDKVIDSRIKILSDTEIEGFRESTGWANKQFVYFYARFSRPFIASGIDSANNSISGSEAEGKAIKAWFRFDTQQNKEVLVKVGISAVSEDGARKNLEQEIKGWNFTLVRGNARDTWNSELSKITVKGGTEDQKTTFYTAFYHAFLVPNLFQDVDGKYRGRDFEIHEAKDFNYYTVFSLWDTFRGEHPLFTLTQQARTVDFIRTMLAQYEEGGRLPVWELAANETECMIGYHSVPVIVDAYMKGIDGFDAKEALEAMRHSAELDHFGLKSYKEHGYIPAEDEAESVSKTLEYAYDDWCIATMAGALGQDSVKAVYLHRAQSYKNIFDPVTDFMRARMNGRWFSPFNPKEVNFNYTEANAWQYTFFVPQDVSGLMAMMGGRDQFTEKLDQLFMESSETSGRDQSDITGMIGQYAHGNEPSHHMAYLYDYVGQPWKTQQRARQIMDDLYFNAPEGLCGNEDCGQMSAWYVLSAMGFYPVTPGIPEYALGSPLFNEIQIHLENGNTFTIKADNNSSKNKFIQSAKLNGEDYPKLYLLHSDILRGGELDFVMAPQPRTDISISDKDIPISAITEDLIMPVPIIGKGSRTFTDTTSVTLRSVTDGAEIYFTTDGSRPDTHSEKYTSPILLDKTATIKAIAVKEGMPESNMLEAGFHKIPKGRSITLNTKYVDQYSAGGDLALIDYIHGPLNFRTGSWQGYQGNDLDAVVDLGHIQLISKVSAGFLQDVGAWIFFPIQVDFYFSNDGKNFQHAGTVKNDVSQKSMEVQSKQFILNLAKKTRYVRVVGKNIGVCPDWHWGAGKKAWLFADEIEIE